MPLGPSPNGAVGSSHTSTNGGDEILPPRWPSSFGFFSARFQKLTEIDPVTGEPVKKKKKSEGADGDAEKPKKKKKKDKA